MDIFAKRTDWDLTKNKVSATLESVKASGQTVIDMTVSNPTKCGLSYPQDEIVNPLLNNENLNYSPDSKGSHDARKVVCDYYLDKGVKIRPEQVFLTSSTSEGYSFLLRLLTDPYQKIFFPKPSYPLFDFLLGINDVVLQSYPVKYDDCWKIDHEYMASTVTVDTKAVILVNPNNPTGSLVGDEDVALINDVCIRNNMAIICDEVFLDYSLDDSIECKTLAGNDSVLTFVLSGLSKVLALPQMKVSWIVVNGPDDVVKEAIERLEVIADTYLSVNTPSQNALGQWMGVRGEIQSEICARIRKNYFWLQTRLKREIKYQLLKADGGWYSIIRVGQDLNEEVMTIDLLEKDNVYIHPGYFFDLSFNCIVLSLLTPEDLFREGVERIVRRL